jgi:hypothetical protein
MEPSRGKQDILACGVQPLFFPWVQAQVLTNLDIFISMEASTAQWSKPQSI